MDAPAKVLVVDDDELVAQRVGAGDRGTASAHNEIDR